MGDYRDPNDKRAGRPMYMGPPVSDHVTSVPMTGGNYMALCTTGADMPMYHEIEEKVVRPAKKKINKREFVMHICRCMYCRSNYPANLLIGYACPMCGAYDFDIERTIENEEAIEMANRSI